MDLLLIRHGAAEPAGPGLPDFERPLSEEGALELTQAVAALGRMGVALGQVLHSPLVRATETAALLAPILDGERIATPLLARPPGLELLDALRRSLLIIGDRGALAAVGHQPYMGELAALLLTGEARLGGSVHFETGTVARMTGRPAPGGMILTGLYDARALSRL